MRKCALFFLLFPFSGCGWIWSSQQLIGGRSSSSCTTYVSDVLSDGPIGYWRLNESSGTNAADLSGNGNNGTYSGDYILGSASLLTSTTDFSTAFNTTLVTGKVQTSVPLLTGVGDFTIEAWASSTNTGVVNYITGNYAVGNGGGIEFYIIAAGNFRVYIGGSVTGTTALIPNTIYYFAATRSSGTVTLYINGLFETSGALAGNITGLTNWAIGNGPDYTAERMLGRIDEVAVYDKVLPLTRIQSHYNIGRQTCY